jgi:hypothetical protein
VARGRLEVRMDQTLERRYRSLQNRPLANHLLRERDALFMFLSCPGLEATNAPSSFPRRPNWINRIRSLHGSQVLLLLLNRIPGHLPKYCIGCRTWG